MLLLLLMFDNPDVADADGDDDDGDDALASGSSASERCASESEDAEGVVCCCRSLSCRQMLFNCSLIAMTFSVT